MDPFHYLPLLARKPCAFDSARPIRNWCTGWPATYERLLSHFRHKNGAGGGTKAFIGVLLMLKEYPEALVYRAIETAVELSLSNATCVRLLMDHWQSDSPSKEILSLDDRPQLAGYSIALPELADYGKLLHGKEVL